MIDSLYLLYYDLVILKIITLDICEVNIFYLAIRLFIIHFFTSVLAYH